MQKFHTDDIHYPDFGSASDWLKIIPTNQKQYQDLGSERHQYRICVLITQTSFCEGSSGDLVKRLLFSRATKYLVERNTSFIENSFRYTFS